MTEAQHEVEGYVSHIAFPASKEELINGLLVRDAPARMVALVERLPRDRYEHRHQLREDLEKKAHLLRNESLSADLLDETACSLLGFADPRDYVIRMKP